MIQTVTQSPLPNRHIYGETLGTWRTADLLIGLAYLARREPPGGETLGDIAAAGRTYGEGLEGDAKDAARVGALGFIIPC